MKGLILVILVAAVTGYVCSSTIPADLQASLEDSFDDVEHVKLMEKYGHENMIEMQQSTRFKLLCRVCKFSAGAVADNIFKNDKLKTFLLNYIKNNSQCANLTFFLKEPCYATLTVTFDFFWQQVTNYWANGRLCYQIKMCSQNDSEVSASQQKIQEFEDSDFVRYGKMIEIIEKSSNNSLTKPHIKNLVCRTCKFTSAAVGDLIFENMKLKNFTLNFLINHSPCANLTGFARFACVGTLTTTFNFFWQQLINYWENGRLCYRIRLCNGTDNALQKVEASGSCQFCEDTVSFIKPFVSLSLNGGDVIGEIDEQCTNSKCKAFVSVYGLKVAQMIEDKMSTKQTCKAIGYCM